VPIIVTDANALTREILDRMPVLLEPHQIDAWVNGTAGTERLKPAADDALRHVARVAARQPDTKTL
jgi:putative SOS response-associated peptidase YedK